jgi:HEAT repeat protein
VAPINLRRLVDAIAPVVARARQGTPKAMDWPALQDEALHVLKTITQDDDPLSAVQHAALVSLLDHRDEHVRETAVCYLLATRPELVADAHPHEIGDELETGVDAVAHLISRFKTSAFRWHLGCFFHLTSLQQEADALGMATIAELDRLTTNGRADLLPLLSDPDDGIRAFAAAYLIDTKPAIAVRVLQELVGTSLTEARDTARDALATIDLQPAIAQTADDAVAKDRLRRSVTRGTIVAALRSVLKVRRLARTTAEGNMS